MGLSKNSAKRSKLLIHWIVAAVGLVLIASVFFVSGHAEWYLDRIGTGLGLMILAAMIQQESRK
jgi:c-di-AMP phosphodiesterase-like protein